MEIAIATLEERLAVGRVALGGIEFARRAPAGDAIPLDIAQMRTRGGHSLCADADQARLHHRAPRAHAAEPIAAGKKTSHAGPTADPAAVEPPAPDQIGRASGRDRVWQYVKIPVVAESLKK